MMSSLCIKPKFNIVEADSNIDLLTIKKLLEEIAPLYPGFDSWFENKFIPSFYSGERKIICAYEIDSGSISGVSLLKITKEENKICTFYVLAEFRGKGLGSRLMDYSLKKFSGPNVVISVSNERLAGLSSILSSKGFVLDHSVKNMYRDNNIEHFFKLK